MFKKVAIIGVGLIGGSMGLAIKKKNLAEKIVGVSRHKETLALAKKRGAIDEGFLDLAGIRGADLLIFASPVETILALAKKAKSLVSRDCLVTDVGSTKEKITAELEKIFPNFVGAHPLAGSERRGVGFANAKLFSGSLCILTPTKKTNKSAQKKIALLWNRLGARVALLPAAKHDEIIGFVSHLPHLVAFSLIQSVPREFLKFAASGLKDTTRISASDPSLWAQIFLSNRNSLKVLDAFQKNLLMFRHAIKAGNRVKLNQLLKKAQQKRLLLE